MLNGLRVNKHRRTMGAFKRNVKNFFSNLKRKLCFGKRKNKKNEIGQEISPTQQPIDQQFTEPKANSRPQNNNSTALVANEVVRLEYERTILEIARSFETSVCAASNETGFQNAAGDNRTKCNVCASSTEECQGIFISVHHTANELEQIITDAGLSNKQSTLIKVQCPLPLDGVKSEKQTDEMLSSVSNESTEGSEIEVILNAVVDGTDTVSDNKPALVPERVLENDELSSNCISYSTLQLEVEPNADELQDDTVANLINDKSYVRQLIESYEKLLNDKTIRPASTASVIIEDCLDNEKEVNVNPESEEVNDCSESVIQPSSNSECDNEQENKISIVSQELSISQKEISDLCFFKIKLQDGCMMGESVFSEEQIEQLIQLYLDTKFFKALNPAGSNIWDFPRNLTDRIIEELFSCPDYPCTKVYEDYQEIEKYSLGLTDSTLTQRIPSQFKMHHEKLFLGVAREGLKIIHFEIIFHDFIFKQK